MRDGSGRQSFLQLKQIRSDPISTTLELRTRLWQTHDRVDADLRQYGLWGKSRLNDRDRRTNAFQNCLQKKRMTSSPIVFKMNKSRSYSMFMRTSSFIGCQVLGYLEECSKFLLMLNIDHTALIHAPIEKFFNKIFSWLMVPSAPRDCNTKRNGGCTDILMADRVVVEQDFLTVFQGSNFYSIGR